MKATTKASLLRVITTILRKDFNVSTPGRRAGSKMFWEADVIAGSGRPVRTEREARKNYPSVYESRLVNKFLTAGQVPHLNRPLNENEQLVNRDLPINLT